MVSGISPRWIQLDSTCHALGGASNNFCTPLRYASDSLTSNEFGWKTQFFGDRLQWNGAIYQENWTNVQFGFFDPGQLGKRLYLAPTRPVPTHRWDYTRPELIRETIELGASDAALHWPAVERFLSPHHIGS